jgi:class 3 adenylate cyclase/predicted ATPase
LGLERYIEAFEANDIDAAVLRTLHADDLKELGVASLGHRKKLLAAISALALPTSATPLAGASAQASAPTARHEAERRQLTVMFVDLVGSTELSERLDPEDMREVIRGYQNTVAGEIGRFEGHVAKFMGDGVLAYFGWPRAHEDEAERAVRAGLAITRAVSSLSDPDDEPLAARVGIATGLVVVGDLVGEGAAQEQAVVGDTPNLAARLQGVAQPGQVVIAGATRRLLGAGFELEDLGKHELKGIGEPEQAFAVTGERPVESRFEAMSGPSLLPMVGRDQELALLLERWAQAKAGEGQGVLLVGEAGIGKSRISRALLDAVANEPHTRIRYQCSPYHIDSALWPVTQQLTHAAGIVADDSADAKLDKLEALLDRGGGRKAAPLIAELLGLDGTARYGDLGLTPQVQRARALDALVQQLLGLATRQAVLVVLEDAHWIDPTTLELIEQLLDRLAAAPVLILLTSRPDNQPRLAAHPHVTRLTLNRLSRAGVEAIVARLGGDQLPTATIGAIIARTDGVPLFVEELTKAVLETGETSIPSSLHDSLMARLDRIPQVKEVAQIAACIGREFDYALLAAIADRPEPALAATLDRLTAAELIFCRGSPPEARYTFKHALVQDAAYRSLLKSKRQQLHARIAEALEAVPNTAETQPELLAHHLTEAGLARSAVDYWLKAGELAIHRSATAEAIAELKRGLDQLDRLPGDLERASLELDLQTALGGAFIAARGFAAHEAGKAYDRARELCRQLGQPPQLFRVLYGQYVFHLVRAELDQALAVAQDLLDAAQHRQQTAPLVIGHRAVGIVSFHRGELAPARTHLEQACAHYDAPQHRLLAFLYVFDPFVASASHLSCSLFALGHPEQARARADAALTWARELGHPGSLALALSNTCLLAQFAGDRRVVQKQADELHALASEQGFAFYAANAMIFEGWSLAPQPREAEGVARIREGIDALTATGAALFVPHFLVLLAQVQQSHSQITQAEETLADALAWVRRTGERYYQAELLRNRGELLLARPTPDPTTAERCLIEALETARCQQAKMWELRAAVSLARLWAHQGKRAQAADLLASVYGWFTEGFDTQDLKDAKALLDTLG